MRVVAILGSPRTQGNSTAIAARFTAVAEKSGATTATYELNRLNYQACQGCYACKKQLERCVLNDDLTGVLDAVSGADLVVLASPVYFGDITAQLKGFIDRTFSYLKPGYMSDSVPSRLKPKKLVFIITQGHPDESFFADIFPRYESFLKWLGFSETYLIRACGVGPASVDDAPEKALARAGELAVTLAGGGNQLLSF